eukprot:sb/3473692/
MGEFHAFHASPFPFQMGDGPRISPGRGYPRLVRSTGVVLRASGTGSGRHQRRVLSSAAPQQLTKNTEAWRHTSFEWLLVLFQLYGLVNLHMLKKYSMAEIYPVIYFFSIDCLGSTRRGAGKRPVIYNRLFYPTKNSEKMLKIPEKSK